MTGDRLGEVSQQHCQYVAASSGLSGQACCAVAMMTATGARCFLRRLQHCVQEQQQETPDNVRVTSLCQFPKDNALFAGTAEGVLCSYPSCGVLSKFSEFGLHS